jgi:hypothetical protein
MYNRINHLLASQSSNENKGAESSAAVTPPVLSIQITPAQLSPISEMKFEVDLYYDAISNGRIDDAALRRQNILATLNGTGAIDDFNSAVENKAKLEEKLEEPSPAIIELKKISLDFEISRFERLIEFKKPAEVEEDKMLNLLSHSFEVRGYFDTIIILKEKSIQRIHISEALKAIKLKYQFICKVEYYAHALLGERNEKFFILENAIKVLLCDHPELVKTFEKRTLEYDKTGKAPGVVKLLNRFIKEMKMFIESENLSRAKPF